MSTITKEFTKEQLIEKLQHRISVASGFPESEKAQMDLELARIALASLEAKPVSVNDDMAYAFHHAISDSSLGSDEVEEIKAGLRAAFANVTAPPAPVAMKDHQIRELVNDLRDIAIEHHGAQQLRERIARTVRAAMLQGADGNSPLIPDGWILVPVEPTMSQEFAGYRTLTDTGKMSRLMKTRLSNIYRAMIAAAPQQEVKS
ncbi:hypothetical protein ACJVDM_14275 [Enterobacter hormaechei]|uniref:hypothetical protein n=1 Tax=Enterobacter hormaechei TaxID=158836 RepID=UPI002FD326D0